jgi:hypothetical protein
MGSKHPFIINIMPDDKIHNPHFLINASFPSLINFKHIIKKASITYKYRISPIMPVLVAMDKNIL